MKATYTITTDQRTVSLTVGDTFARNPGERVLAVKRDLPGTDLDPEEKRWFLSTITPHQDWTFSE